MEQISNTSLAAVEILAGAWIEDNQSSNSSEPSQQIPIKSTKQSTPEEIAMFKSFVENVK